MTSNENTVEKVVAGITVLKKLLRGLLGIAPQWCWYPARRGRILAWFNGNTLEYKYRVSNKVLGKDGSVLRWNWFTRWLLPTYGESSFEPTRDRYKGPRFPVLDTARNQSAEAIYRPASGREMTWL